MDGWHLGLEKTGVFGRGFEDLPGRAAGGRMVPGAGKEG